MRDIETVLFDLGGVLVDWNPRYLYRKIFKDQAEMERFLAEVCHPHWNHLHDQGMLSFANSIPDLQHRYPQHHDEIAHEHPRLACTPVWLQGSWVITLVLPPSYTTRGSHTSRAVQMRIASPAQRSLHQPARPAPSSFTAL